MNPSESTAPAAATAAQVELRGIDRVFKLGDSEVHALRHIDLQISAGEYMAVMGPSGSGKSTLLNVLGLLDAPNAGHYLLEGRDVTTLSPDEQATVRSQRIGFVFQTFHLVPRLTAAQNIELPMVLSGIDPVERQPAGRACAGRVRPDPARRAPPRRAVGRPAPARGDCARHRDGAGLDARR